MRVRDEDFEVEEVPSYEPCGSGDHLYLWVEKRGIAPEFFARTIAQRLGTHPGNIGTAGLKDRHAITRQWVIGAEGVRAERREARRRRHSRTQDRPAHQQAQARSPARQPLPHPRSRRRQHGGRGRDPRPHSHAGHAELLRPAAVRPRRRHRRSRLAVPRGQSPSAHPPVPVPLRALRGAVAALQRLPRAPDSPTASSARCSTAT